jgi:hypothetical protein
MTTMTIMRHQVRQEARERIRDEVRERLERIRESRQEREQRRAEEAREAEEAAREAAEEALREANEAMRGIRVPPAPRPPVQQPQVIVHPRRPWEREEAIPDEVVDIVGMLTFGTAAVLILRPLMRAFANRFERRGAPPVLSPEVTAQMTRLEQAIDAVAIEVERISEGQRYTTKLLADRVGKEG